MVSKRAISLVSMKILKNGGQLAWPTAIAFGLLLFRCSLGAGVTIGLRLNLFRNLLNFAEDPHQVAAKNFVEIGCLVATLVECLSNLRQVGRGIQPLRRAVDAIKVRA